MRPSLGINAEIQAQALLQQRLDEEEERKRRLLLHQLAPGEPDLPTLRAQGLLRPVAEMVLSTLSEIPAGAVSLGMGALGAMGGGGLKGFQEGMSTGREWMIDKGLMLEPETMQGAAMKRSIDTALSIPGKIVGTTVEHVTGSPGAGLAAELAVGAITPGGGKKVPRREIFTSRVPKDAAAKVEELQKAGASAEEIWKQTKVWAPTEAGPQPIGGKPLYEIQLPKDLRIKKQTPSHDKATANLMADWQGAQNVKQALWDINTNQLPVPDAISKYSLGPHDAERLQKLLVLEPAVAGKWAETRIRNLEMMGQNVWKGAAPASERLPAGELYQLHPELASMPVRVRELDGQLLGAYDPRAGDVTVSPNPTGWRADNYGTSKAQTMVGLHEMGHAVQRKAGMPQGGSPESAWGQVDQAYRQGLISADQRDLFRQNMTDFDLYERLGGEALSRLAEKRWADQTYARPPWYDLDVPLEEIIAPRLGPGGSALAAAVDDPKKANNLLRAQMWEEMDQAAARYGKQGKTGRYVGGPPSVTSHQKRTATAKGYAEHIQRALDAGIPPGYFYEEGRKALAEVTDNPQAHRRVAEIMGPTSTQVSPAANVDYTARVLDQNAMGMPISATLYPNAKRPVLEAILRGEEPWMGHKLERYTGRLSPQQLGDYAPNETNLWHIQHPAAMLPPKDQWEGFGVGWERGYVPAGAPQVSYADMQSVAATDRVNVARAKKGERPLTFEEGQELHWVSTRVEEKLREKAALMLNKQRKKPMPVGTKAEKAAVVEKLGGPLTWDKIKQITGENLTLDPKDTIRGALDQIKIYHPWEPEPGGLSGLARGPGVTKEDWAREVAALTLDPQGKDKFIRAVGGELQSPATPGVGVWEGKFSPNYASKSYGSSVGSKGWHPATQARVEAGELLRQLALGQDATAAHMELPQAKKAGLRNVVGVNLGRPATPAEMAIIADEAQQALTPGGMWGAPVHTPEGVNILNVSEAPDNRRFQAAMNALGPRLQQQGINAPIEPKAASTFYHDRFGAPEKAYQEGSKLDLKLGAAQGGQTAAFLRGLGNLPKGAQARLNSPQARALMGEVEDFYKQMSAAGKIKGAEAMQRLANAYRRRGIPGVKSLLRQGLAPAAAVLMFEYLMGPDTQGSDTDV